ncbi:MAG TPA: DNA polymerase Y family protein [Rhodocyclaceae bacterium]
MLWLALWLPDLPLIAHPGRPLPSAVVDRGRLLACDETATAAGLMPGMRAATARGMLPELALLPRNPVAEATVLDELACWAGQYTPDIVLAPPAALLLEIGGCLRLFGGIDAVLAAVGAGCRERDLAPRMAAAPTPQAALWLAQGSESPPSAGVRPPVIPTREALPDMLAPLPAQLLAASEQQAQQLASFGLKTLGEALRLPLAGLARRLGGDCAVRIEQALGERPDLRPRFVFPERFRQRLTLPGIAHEAGALCFAGDRLIGALCGWLVARQQGVLRCTLTLGHEALPGKPRESMITLTLTTPTRTPQRIARVLRELLERTELPAPVETLTLSAEHCEDLAGKSRALFDTAGSEPEGIELLVEQLRARLGESAVHGISPAAGHRPENATRHTAVGASTTTAMPAAPPRPLLLLPQPETLREIDGRPHQQRDPLELLAGPERIESGWWDGGEPGATGDIRRDYFIARNRQDEYLWIYRTAEGWHLHGIFA